MFYEPNTGLYLTRTRAYSPNLGRWLSRDPLGEGADPAANLYRYVGGNPIDLLDPLGLCSQSPPFGLDPGLVGLMLATIAAGGGPEDLVADALALAELGIGEGAAILAAEEAAAAEEATPLILQNAANGQAFEQAVINALGLTKNTVSLSVDGLGTSIPDLIDEFGNITEIKSGMNLSFTNQLQIQAQGAEGSFNLIVGPNTQYISGPLQNAVNASGGTIQVFNPATGAFTLW
jgi:RHS repeat-associated protein